MTTKQMPHPSYTDLLDGDAIRTLRESEALINHHGFKMRIWKGSIVVEAMYRNGDSRTFENITEVLDAISTGDLVT